MRVVVVVVVGMSVAMTVRMPTAHLVVSARFGVEGGIVVFKRGTQQLGQFFEDMVGWETYPASFRIFT